MLARLIILYGKCSKNSNRRTTIITLTKYWDRLTFANSVDPDQTPQNAISDKGLLCLPYIQQQVVKWTLSNLRTSKASIYFKRCPNI